MEPVNINKESLYRDALRFIATTNDSGHWIEAYRRAGGGYEGLQAVAQVALEAGWDWE